MRQYTSRHDLSYQLGAAYQQTAEDVNSTRVSGGTVPVPTHGHTDRMYNVAGELVKESDINAPDTTRYFANDPTGHVLTEIQGNFDGANGHLTLAQAWNSAMAHTSGDAQKAQYFFYTNGNYVGSFGQIQSGGQFVANFDVNYTPVSSQYPASTPSTVVAQSGDTLRILASRIYGDANLWYIIAQSNGLTNPDATITVGTTLIVPNQVASLSNTSSSFKPFDLSQAMGDTTPVQPLPPPPSHGGCGVLGTVLILVVAIIVTVYSAGLAASVIAPAATAAGGAVGTASLGAAALTGSLVGASGATLVGTSIAAAAIGGAVGSIVSQELGVAIGAQDSFSWKNVALGAVGAGVGAGLAGSSQVGDLLAGLGKSGSLAAEAAADSAITQGIGVTTGLQSSFSWRQVAESAIAAPVAASAGKYAGQFTGSTFAGQFASGATGSLVRQAVGGKVNMTSVLTDAFGNALGNSVAAAATTPSASAQNASAGGSSAANSSFATNTFNATSFRNSAIDQLSLDDLSGPASAGEIGAGLASAENIAEGNINSSTPLEEVTVETNHWTESEEFLYNRLRTGIFQDPGEDVAATRARNLYRMGFDPLAGQEDARNLIINYSPVGTAIASYNLGIKAFAGLASGLSLPFVGANNAADFERSISSELGIDGSSSLGRAIGRSFSAGAAPVHRFLEDHFGAGTDIVAGSTVEFAADVAAIVGLGGSARGVLPVLDYEIRNPFVPVGRGEMGSFGIKGFQDPLVAPDPIPTPQPAPGTLERGDINSNIEGGVPEGYRGHHLIGVAEAQSSPVMAKAAELGYDINRGSNGIALPADAAESLETGLPLHTGRHLPEYTSYVETKLNELQIKYDLGVVTQDNLLEAVSNVEDDIRSALTNNEIRLQSTDPRPR